MLALEYFGLSYLLVLALENMHGIKDLKEKRGGIMNENQVDQLEIMIKKEQALSKLIVWLKAKGLFEEAMNDIGLIDICYPVKKGLEEDRAFLGAIKTAVNKIKETKSEEK